MGRETAGGWWRSGDDEEEEEEGDTVQGWERPPLSAREPSAVDELRINWIEARLDVNNGILKLFLLGQKDFFLHSSFMCFGYFCQ